MPTAVDLRKAQSEGLTALDQAEAEILSALPKADAGDDRARLDGSHALRLDYALHHHMTTKGRALDWSDPWLRPIFEDRHPRKVLRKCVQVGISEYLVVYTLADAAAGRTVFYVLPTFDLRNRFVAQRVDRPLLLVPEYRKRLFEAIGETDNKGLKAFGAGAMYFVSSDTPRSFLEVAADTVIVDELDRCDQENLELAPDRLEHAEFPVMIEVANPTHPQTGISERYDASDMRTWQVKCRGCGEWQEIDFFTNVLQVTRDEAGEIKSYELLDRDWKPESARDIKAYCRRCGKSINRLETDPKRAQWVAEHPGRDIIGWTIGHLMTARCTIRDLWSDWKSADGNPTRTARFINNRLGRSYSPAGSALTPTMLQSCEVEGVKLVGESAGPCTMGVDVGSLWDVRISDSPAPGLRRARLIGRFHAMEPVLDLMARFNVRCCVIDAKPEIEMARRFQKAAQEKFGRGSRHWIVWRCEFVKEDTARDASKEETEGLVKVNRTVLFDEAMADLRARRNQLPAHSDKLLDGEYWRQMMAPKRQLVVADGGAQRYIWTKGVDHQRLADCYDKLAQLIQPKPLVTTFTELE